jgi:multidrug resistance efflux pump
MVLFEKESHEHLTRLSQLNTAVSVVGLKGWLTLAFFLLLTVAVFLWSIFGSIPIAVNGNCLIFAASHIKKLSYSSSGTVKKIYVNVNDRVHKGQLLMEIDDPVLEMKIKDQEELLHSIDESGSLSSDLAYQMNIEKIKQKNILDELLYQKSLLKVVSQHEGTLIQIFVSEGGRVDIDVPILYVREDYEPDSLIVLAFMALSDGQRLKSGMETFITLDNVDSAKYGSIKATIDEVHMYPTDKDDYYTHLIPSSSLQNYFLKGPTPKILLIIKPQLSSDTPSHLAWSSKEGPPSKVQSGSIGTAQVIIERKKPISYILPSVES